MAATRSSAAACRSQSAGLGGAPRLDGIAGRLSFWLAQRDVAAGDLLRQSAERFGFEPDPFIHELINAILGDHYPAPVQMLRHGERIVHEYLVQKLCGTPRPEGQFDLFATEGGTAAIREVFNALRTNRLLRPGDHIALGAPVFSPYLEIPGLEDYQLVSVHVTAPQQGGFKYPAEELAKLEVPRVRAFFSGQSRQSDLGRDQPQGTPRDR